MKPNAYNQHIFNNVTSARQLSELANMPDPLENQFKESIKQTQILHQSLSLNEKNVEQIQLMYNTILENQKSNTKQTNIVIWLTALTLVATILTSIFK